MIQMKFYLGGVIDVPDDPALIGRLMSNGFRQTDVAANAHIAHVQKGYSAGLDQRQIEATALGISKALEEGYVITQIELLPATAEETEHAG